ncbi:hypothetical protein CRE_06237 [Caenorhabditis remanei]|uniref:Uncharacterized protein n=1 Tax=Caenorhabditis remanei TaxID=31234 RepID=E3NSJ1_CAERE|nr:hypothetical protein CRE_06237 [Caenorhabditis remanei]
MSDCSREIQADAEIIWGVACSKSLLYGNSEEEDSTTKTTESVMIVSGSIEYERVSNKLSSIEPIIVQEEKFLEKQIDRIATKRASLILVEGGVSRIAAQLLHAKGIKVAVNVKMSILQRVSRATGADIVSNSDAQLVEQNLWLHSGVEQRKLPPEDGRIKFVKGVGDWRKNLVGARLREGDRSVCEKRRAIVNRNQLDFQTESEMNLYSAMLSSSPVIEFEPPFLETAIGR